MGLESAGTVTEVGSDVTGITVGQQVMAMGPGSQAEYVAVNGNLVFPYPNSLDAVEAGGMPIVFLTAYHILKSRGQMQSGDTVLVQAGASGVGTVLIQLAKAWGAKVIATASTQDKLDLCKSLGADVVINYTEADFEEVVKDESGGDGVKLVAECVGGEVLEKSVRCVSAYGTLVSYGNASQTPANLPASDITSVNRTVVGFSMGRSPVGSLDHKAAMAEMFPMIAAGQAKLVVDQILPMAEVGKAHQHLANRGAMGKVILTP
jgi:NADPH2:quinone reductase